MPTGVYIRTKEHREKVSKGLMGNKNSLGYRQTTKTRRKRSKSMKKAWADGKLSRVFSEERRAKLSKSHKGYVMPEEQKEKISRSLLGKKRPLFSKEWKRKMSEARKGYIPWNKGMKLSPHSEETKRKMSKNNARYWLGKKRSPETLRKLAQVRLKQSRSKEPTSIEKKLYQELKDQGLLFEQQKLINSKFVVDAYIPSLNLIIEADGDYWHSLESVMRKDKSQNAYLTKCGFNLLRLTGTEINDGSFKKRLTERTK